MLLSDLFAFGELYEDERMKFHQFLELLEEGEGLHVEFKRKVSMPEKIAHEMIAFANTSGGTILFGVDDDGSIVGVVSEKEELFYVEEAAVFHSQPPVGYSVSIFQVTGRYVICVEVPESSRKPHYFMTNNDEERVAYVRVGENSIQASREMIRVMSHRVDSPPVRIILGEAERRLFAFYENKDRITVKEYAQLTNISERRASRLLIRLVHAGVLAIHTHEKADYFSLVHNVK